MMTRSERIEYEILDCALNRTSSQEGWPTSLDAFLTQLRNLFPDVERQELIEACKRLAKRGVLTLRKKELGRQLAYRDYRGKHDDEAFFHETLGELRFQEAPISRAYFSKLTALIVPPAGLKRPWRL
jgi:hypothetical protein